jgi:hypothetical protein
LKLSIDRISSLRTCTSFEFEFDKGDKGGEFEEEKCGPLNKIEVGDEEDEEFEQQ